MVRLGHEKSRQRAGVGAAQRIGRRPGGRGLFAGAGGRDFEACIPTPSAAGCARRASKGADALKAKPTPGRPRKLTARQEKTVLGWVAKLPTSFGFPTDLWTSRRLAALIEQRLGHPLQQQLSGRVAARPRAVPAEARPTGPGTRRGRHRALERGGLATPAKKAREEKAHLVLIDESGFFPEPAGAPHLGTERKDARAALLGPAPRQGVGHRRLERGTHLRLDSEDLQAIDAAFSPPTTKQPLALL